ncbi:MAG TPA: hypothetical protein VFB62_18735 [Polyangiaceae bacterium]|nr:hypothetical protein [Polyangiaceae bacterium]
MKWLLVIALLAAVVSACADDHEPVRMGRGVYVRATWHEARGVVGHRVHVVEKKIACAECHDLSGEEIDKPGPGKCAKCHAKESGIHHAIEQARKKAGSDAPSDCMQCHAFVPRKDEDSWACMSCHASRQDDTPAVVIHKQSTCDTCHRPHAQKEVTPSNCQECHEEVTTEHASAGKQPSQVCTTCHEKQHARAQAARSSCAPCHASQQPIVPATALFEGHGECTGCHRPHDYKKSEAVACRSCHEQKPVLGGGRIPEHSNCASCHKPHAPREVGACLGCHKAQSTDHPQGAATTQCGTCHVMHPSMGKEGPARACSNCHHAAASDTAFHGKTACKGCHAPHKFKLASTDRGLCSRCHAGQVTLATSLKGHASCEGCHSGLPHRPGWTTGCSTCHGQIAGSAIKDHRQCKTCHEPHGGKVSKACTSCHATEKREAPPGHQACSSCHEPHRGSVAKTCSACHATQAKAPHANVKGGCTNCHSAHGPRGATHAPSCTSCHPVAKLAALHKEPKHQECSQCHRTHEKQLSRERPLCLTCHQDRQNHFADGPRCSSCHLFR